MTGLVETAVWVCFGVLLLTLPLDAVKVHDVAGYVPPGDVYWSESIERRLEPPFSEQQRKDFVASVRSQRVTKLQSGCGRLRNRLATLQDGSRVCCRARDRNELRGDLYSYFFNNFLGLWNVPPTTMVTLDLNSEQWRDVRSEALEAGWEDASTILMVLYVDGLQEEYIPGPLKPPRALLTQDSVKNLTESEQLQLLQWTDMIVFDFIIGHTDRLFNTLLNYQWNSHMLDRSVHNLAKTKSGKLVLIDNESGFWVGYASAEWKQVNYDLQIQFLKEICLFRKGTVRSLMQLHELGKTEMPLENYMQETDSASFKAVRKLKAKERANFQLRLETVRDRILQCSVAP